ncbi:MAG TPA: aldo/keto reductase [Persephonella sp.]|uniref:Aldo/keto reductase n=1 Tax=Persephonella marina (strain DSM 14350 / EX-H1) TaxID=123214 RepID=C0QSQ9_PERMH|nr:MULTISPECIES: aldo/keto reductase [Persephonella]ACO03983.1 aldo/keto reductase [Persephonella marina EX-H1]HCB70657.1 aldo/keto reductase [Persephonella sp.]
MLYKEFLDYRLSEIGIGTYLGASDQDTDIRYYETITEGIQKGINVIDTAINYRNMRSEKVIGDVLKNINREKVVISTKGGYIPVPYYIDEDPTQWFKREFVQKEIVSPKEITETGNIITPRFIDWSFEKSLENLNTEYIDVYFLHNPEDQLLKFNRDTFYKKIWTVFRLLEGKVHEGKLKYYGLATWNGLRVPEDHQQHIDLKKIFDIAREVGGENHHFRFIQLPYNIAMIEAYTLKNQRINGKSLTTFEASKRLGLYTYISSPLMQRRLVRPVHQQILERFRVKKFSHIPIQFVRSTEGVGTVLIGMSRKEHLIENLEIQEIPHLKPEEIDSMIKERGY